LRLAFRVREAVVHGPYASAGRSRLAPALLRRPVLTSGPARSGSSLAFFAGSFIGSQARWVVSCDAKGHRMLKYLATCSVQTQNTPSKSLGSSSTETER